MEQAINNLTGPLYEAVIGEPSDRPSRGEKIIPRLDNVEEDCDQLAVTVPKAIKGSSMADTECILLGVPDRRHLRALQDFFAAKDLKPIPVRVLFFKTLYA